MIYRMLQTGCLFAGILCFTYFIIVLLYAGIFTSALFLWPLGGGFLFVCAWAVRHAQMHKSIVSYLLMAVLLAGLLIVAGICIYWCGKILPYTMQNVTWIHKNTQIQGEPEGKQTEQEYVIILGAHVKRTVPSKALQRRLDKALWYEQQSPGAVFVLSGGRGFGEDITEAQCMEEYLAFHQIAPDRLWKEEKSTSTRENLLFSDELYDLKKCRVGILSNDFHVYRALQLAKALGYQQVFGIAAPSDLLMQPHNILREICCLIKERLLSHM